MLALLPLMLLQVGPMPSTGPVSAVPEELQEQRRLNRARAAAIDESRPDDPVRACFAQADADAETARANYAARLNAAAGTDRAVAAHCLGYALSALERWDEAEQAFISARDAVPADDAGRRAELGAAAAIAAAARGDFTGALTLYQAAQSEAQRAGDAALTGRIARDMAHPLHQLGQAEAAAATLAQARAALPDDPATWLISARLSRQQDRLAEAQQQIERAALLDPRNPEVGLEAGVIAALAGNEDAARKSWQSVVTTAGDSPVASAALRYLDQLGEPTTAEAQ